ncbi:MAG: Yip1 family protein [Terricaulis sp.]
MSADNDAKPEAPRSQNSWNARFSIDEARARLREAVAKSESILSRAWGLVSSPKAEWEQIRAEDTTIANILIGYVAPLAAIPPVADLIGSYLWGGASLVEFGGRLVGAIVAWVVGVAMVYLLGIVINATAENFDSMRDELAAQKIAAYSLTPFFISTLLLLWPPLLFIPVLALGLMVFLIYRGLPILMHTREDRALSYTATITVAAIVTFAIQMSVAGCMT